MPGHESRYRALGAIVMLAVLATVFPATLAAQDLVAQASALQQRGQLDSALKVAERAVVAEPARAEAHYRMGDIAGQRAGQIGGIGAFGLARKCKAGYGRAVHLEPENPKYLESLAQYLSQAPGIVGGDRDSALGLAEHLRRLDEPRGMLLMAEILGRGNARQKARADSVMDAFGRAHVADRALQVRVGIYWAQRDRPERALAAAEQLLARDSSDGVARYYVARNLVVLKRDASRAQRLLRSLVGRPLPPEGAPRWSPEGVWWRLGQSWMQLGERDSARTAYLEALRLSPNHRPARMSLDSLGP